MRRFFGKISGNRAYIEGDELKHLRLVLRFNVGDKVLVIDGSKFEYLSKIIEIKKDCAVLEVLEKIECKALPKKNIVLFQSLIKRENFELIVEKSCELGVVQIVPFVSEFTDKKNTFLKPERLEKILIGASKQSDNCLMPKIESVLTFEQMLKSANMLDICLFANEKSGKDFDFSVLKNYQNIGIIIGPEGGFSDSEVDKILAINAKNITLGKRILKADTAAIMMMSLASLFSKN